MYFVTNMEKVTMILKLFLQLWKASDLSLIGVMRGHRKGIWCVEFSPVDQVRYIHYSLFSMTYISNGNSLNAKCECQHCHQANLHVCTVTGPSNY